MEFFDNMGNPVEWDSVVKGQRYFADPHEGSASYFFNFFGETYNVFFQDDGSISLNGVDTFFEGIDVSDCFWLPQFCSEKDGRQLFKPMLTVAKGEKVSENDLIEIIKKHLLTELKNDPRKFLKLETEYFRKENAQELKKFINVTKIGLQDLVNKCETDKERKNVVKLLKDITEKVKFEKKKVAKEEAVKKAQKAPAEVKQTKTQPKQNKQNVKTEAQNAKTKAKADKLIKVINTAFADVEKENNND